MAKIQDKLYNRIIEGELLELTEEEKVKLGLGKKLYKHTIKFHYEANTLSPYSDIFTSDYIIDVLMGLERPLTADDDLEYVAFNENKGLLLNGYEDNADNQATRIFIIQIGNGAETVDFIIGYFELLVTDNYIAKIVRDDNESFTIISDTVTEWN